MKRHQEHRPLTPSLRIFRCAMFAIFISTAAPLSAQHETTVDKIVAVVGNEIITNSELEIQLLRIAMKNKIDPKDQGIRRRILDDLISRKLVLAQAVLDSVEVSEEQVTGQLNEQIKMLEQNYGSIEKLEQAAGMNIAQMKREYREDIRKNLMIETLQREKFGDISVTQRETEEFFRAYQDSLPLVPEQVDLQQITIYPKVVDVFRGNARKKAEAILDSLRAGADFAEMARKHSDDAGSARNGGDLGLARRGVFVKEFEEAVFSLKPGEISPIVETKFGFHIIKLVEKKGEAVRASHILIRVQKTGESDDAAIARLKQCRDRVLAGEDFAAVAKEVSEDAATKNVGGEMGLIEIPQLSDDMRLVQQKLNPGEISEPVKITLEGDYAYALVRMSRRVPQHPASLADDYQRIASYARIFKQNRLYTEWIESIKKNVYWRVSL